MKTLLLLFTFATLTVAIANACDCGYKPNGDVEITCWYYADGSSVCIEEPVCTAIEPVDPEWHPWMCDDGGSLSFEPVADRVRVDWRWKEDFEPLAGR